MNIDELVNGPQLSPVFAEAILRQRQAALRAKQAIERLTLFVRQRFEKASFDANRVRCSVGFGSAVFGFRLNVRGQGRIINDQETIVTVRDLALGRAKIDLAE